MNVSHTLPDQLVLETVKLNLLMGTPNIFITVFVQTVASIIVIVHDFEKWLQSMQYLLNVPDKYYHLSTGCPLSG
jgi:uncharacterized membrane protein